MTKFFSISNINIALNATAFFITIILLAAALFNNDRREPAFRWFYRLTLATFIILIFDAVVVSFVGIPGESARRIIRTADFFAYFSMGPMLMIGGMYFYAFISTKTQVSRSFVYLQLAFALAITLLVAAAHIWPIVWQLDDDNNYHKMSFYWLYALIPILTLSSCAALVIAKRKFLKTRELVALLTYTITPGICYALEIIFVNLWLVYFGTAIALFLLYINIQIELKHTLREKEEELAESRIAIMLSQIQPHFIFNTLSSIVHVCEGNPIAQKCLITFSEYLRGNMNALTQKDPILFEQELEHVRQYLSLEALRFEERLKVEYDIQVRDFMLPVLTLQPIVENAVKHGVTGRASGGTVQIRTEASEAGVQIVVTDDGVGFDTSIRQDCRVHTGIENVRARLTAIGGGQLSVESVPGQGTKATILIPAWRPSA